MIRPLLAVLCLLAVAPSAQAQESAADAPLRVGDRVRLSARTVANPRLEGRISRLGRDTLWLRVAPDYALRLATEHLTRLEVAVPRPRRDRRRVVVLSSLGGALLTGLAGSAFLLGPTGDGGNEHHPALVLAGSGAVGALLGGGVGLLATRPGHAWEPVALPPSHAHGRPE